MNILSAEEWHVLVARFALAGALVGSIGSDGNVAKLRQALRIKPCNLFLNAAIGVGNNNGRVFLRRVVVGRGVDIGGNLQPV